MFFKELLAIVLFLVMTCACAKDSFEIEIEYLIDEFIPHTVSNPRQESIAHGSYIISSDYEDSFYVAYYSGEHADIEFIYKTDINVKLTKISKATLSNDLSCTVLDKGEKVGMFLQSTIDSPYDPCLLEFEDFIRVWMVVTPQNDYNFKSRSIGYRDVLKEGLTPVDSLTVCKIQYIINEVEYCDDISVSNLNLFADRIRGVSNHYVGGYPVFNGVKQINGSLYTVLSFISDKNNKSITPCILRSDDGGAIWKFISNIPEKFDSSRFWEVGWDYDNEKLYIVSRSCDSLDSPCFTFDLKQFTWSEYAPLFNGDVDDSRPAITLSNNNMFVLQNVYPRVADNRMRTRVRVAKTTHDFAMIHYVDIIADKGCSYFSLVNSGNKFYLLFTEDYRRIASGNKGDIALANITSLINKL